MTWTGIRESSPEKRPFVGKRLQEKVSVEQWQNPPRNPPAYVHAARSENFQREISRFGSQYGDENLQALPANGARMLPIHRILDNEGRWVGDGPEGFREVRCSSSRCVSAQESIDVLDPQAGADAFIADMAGLFPEVPQEVGFQVVSRSKVAMTAFGGLRKEGGRGRIP